MSVVAERIRRWLRRVAIGRFALSNGCRSVCGSEERVFEPRLGKRDLCTYDLHKGLALLTLNSHTLHDTVTIARLLL